MSFLRVGTRVVVDGGVPGEKVAFPFNGDAFAPLVLFFFSQISPRTEPRTDFSTVILALCH
jgi:hypothetical protein